VDTKQLLINLGKLLLCSIVFFIGMQIGSMAASLMGLRSAPMAPGVDRNLSLLYALLTSPLVALALVLLAAGLPGSLTTRALILAFLTWIAYGVNDQLEGLLVSTYSTGFSFAIVESLVASLLLGAAAAALFPPAKNAKGCVATSKAFFARRGTGTWIWRLVIASVVFVPIYVIFGLLTYPFVSDYYQNQMYGLQEPAADQLLNILFVRSVLFFIACLPIFITWQDSRRNLFLRLGFGLFVLVAAPSIFTAYWLPLSLRLPHALEILAGEFVYVGVLIVLLTNSSAYLVSTLKQSTAR
jgi:hypothetical protein